jgi:hypothetical protein
MSLEREYISLENIVPILYDVTMNISKMFDELTSIEGIVIYEFSVIK